MIITSICLIYFFTYQIDPKTIFPSVYNYFKIKMKKYKYTSIQQ